MESQDFLTKKINSLVGCMIDGAYHGNIDQVSQLIANLETKVPGLAQCPGVKERIVIVKKYLKRRKEMEESYSQAQASYIIRTFGDPQENPTHLEMLESVTNYFDEEFWENYASLEDIVEELSLEDEEHEEALAFCHNPLIPVEIGT